MRKTLSVIATSLLAAGLLTSAASAGTVYVALASNQVLDGVEYQTVLEVSNPALVPRSFTTHFIETFVDGTDRPDETQSPITVPPGQTLIFTGLANGAARGMLEITGDNELVFSARLVPVGDETESLGGRVPVISSENVVGGGQRFFVQGILRDDTRETAFGIINLNKANNECSVDLVGSDGVRRMQTAVLSLAPLSANQWDDVLDVVGITADVMVRAEVQCSGPAYAYALVVDSETGEVSGLDVAQTGASLLSAPGQELPCPEGAECFEWAGLLHRPSPGDEIKTVKAELTPGSVYRTLKLRMSIDLPSWNSQDPSGIHNFFWLYRNLWAGNTFGYVNVRGPNRNKVSNLTNVDLPRGVTKTTRIDRELAPGQTYVVDYTYDTRSGEIQTLILDQSGGVVASMSDSVSTNTIRQEGEGFFVQVGLEGHFNEVPSYGWNYRDLRLDFIP